jgi:hypothetical protein
MDVRWGYQKKDTLNILQQKKLNTSSRQLNIRKTDITANLHKKQKTVNGFIFKFKNDNLC